MRLALRLARKGYGKTSPNPMVGAVLVRRGKIIGRGWHRRAGQPHAEIEALADARARGASVKGATLFVTLEPCSTTGRTPPCTEALQAAGLRRIVIAAKDPNPAHRGRGHAVLRAGGCEVTGGILEEEAIRLNTAFNHWIVRRTPLVTVKAAMSLDAKIATVTGESKWITGRAARSYAMRMRQGSDAILVGVNTILMDDPKLTVRNPRTGQPTQKHLRRIILDSLARTPVRARVVSDERAAWTTLVATRRAPPRRLAALRKRVNLWIAPERKGKIDLSWVLKKLGREQVISLLVEGGGEVNAAFLLNCLAQHIVFFYAPIVIGGAQARKAVAGAGAASLSEAARLRDVQWQRLGEDLLLKARLA